MSYGYQHEPANRRGLPPSRKDEIKSKIDQIMQLCRDQNASANRDLSSLIQAQKGVYDLLQQTQPAAPTMSTPPIPSTITPIRPVKEQYSQLHQDIGSIIRKNSHVALNDEALRLIDQIERRAMAEVEKVREEKNFLARRVAELERELEAYRQGGAGPQQPSDSTLKNRIAYLEGLLSQGQGGMPDFNLLYEQGEAIRQDTIRLLKLKEGRMGEDNEKAQLREQVSFLQQKIQSLEAGRGPTQVTKPSFETITEQYSPIGRSLYKRHSANEYESLVMQMREITGN